MTNWNDHDLRRVRLQRWKLILKGAEMVADEKIAKHGQRFLRDLTWEAIDAWKQIGGLVEDHWYKVIGRNNSGRKVEFLFREDLVEIEVVADELGASIFFSWRPEEPLTYRYIDLPNVFCPDPDRIGPALNVATMFLHSQGFNDAVKRRLKSVREYFFDLSHRVEQNYLEFKVLDDGRFITIDLNRNLLSINGGIWREFSFSESGKIIYHDPQKAKAEGIQSSKCTLRLGLYEQEYMKAIHSQNMKDFS